MTSLPQQIHRQLRSGSGSEEGYALVEILAALALVSVVAAIMLQSGAQFRSLMRAETELRDNAASDAVVRHMAKMIELSERIALLESDSGDVYFHGAPESIRFVSEARLGAESMGFGEIGFSLINAGNEGRLAETMQRRRAHAMSDQSQTMNLLDGVSGISFSYFGAPNDSVDPLWLEHWSYPHRLPSAVRIKLDRDMTSIESIAIISPVN